eukprot:COSAG05_NODE_497_length_9246_cov_6.935343_1_plen_37_part_10
MFYVDNLDDAIFLHNAQVCRLVCVPQRKIDLRYVSCT